MSKIDKNLIDPAVEPESEKAHRVVRAAIAAVPALGGTLVEAFNALIERIDRIFGGAMVLLGLKVLGTKIS